jgi:hypothetical protein
MWFSKLVIKKQYRRKTMYTANLIPYNSRLHKYCDQDNPYVILHYIQIYIIKLLNIIDTLISKRSVYSNFDYYYEYWQNDNTHI